MYFNCSYINNIMAVNKKLFVINQYIFKSLTIRASIKICVNFVTYHTLSYVYYILYHCTTF